MQHLIQLIHQVQIELQRQKGMLILTHQIDWKNKTHSRLERIDMGRISKVIYEEVSRDNNVDEYYWYQNMLGLAKSIDEEYMEYEYKQTQIRNSILNDIIKRENITPKLNTVVFGTSSLNNSTVLIAEYY